MADTLGSALRDELARLYEPLTAVVDSPGGVIEVLRSVGRAGPIESNEILTAELGRIARLVSDIAAMDETQLRSWEDLDRILQLSADLAAALRGLDAIASDPALADEGRGLGVDLVSWLTGLYLRNHHPALYRLAALLTLVTPADVALPAPLVVDDGVVTRLPTRGARIHGDRIPGLVRDFNGTMRAHYMPGDLATAEETHALAHDLFPALRALGGQLGLASFADVDDVGAAPSDVGDSDVETGEMGWPRTDDEGTVNPGTLPPPIDTSVLLATRFPRLVVALPALVSDANADASGLLGFSVVASSAEHPEGVRGLILGLWLGGDAEEVRARWRLEVTGDGELPGVVLGPDGLTLAPLAPTTAGAQARVVAERIADPGEPAFRFGSADGSRIEIGGLRVGLHADIVPGRLELATSLDASSAAVVISGGDGDGFLRHILPAEGIRGRFDLGLTVSSLGGLSLRGAAGLAASIPVGSSVGPLRLSAVDLAIRPADDSIVLEAGASVTVRLGPTTIVVDGVGLQVQAAFPEGGGNLGVADLALNFKPPAGLGLTIDAGPIQGGGFLGHDSDSGTYGGLLELVVGRLEVKAFGLLTIRSDGYSLIIVLSAEFPEPISLPFGWRLAGVGGLIGIHHRLDVSALQERLREGSASQILFPSDPIAVAPTILTSLSAVFPAAKGQFLIGPLFRLFWGARGLATLSVAVILEMPAPSRVLILGRLDVTAPHTGFELLVLRVEFAGVIDFERPSFELDAPIIDSRLGPFALSGDVAVRMRGGEESLFLLTAGGFHPRFPVPTNANLPTLRRIAVALSSDDNPRARVELYTAITSSTWQIGGKLEVSASKGSFSAAARLSVDAIFGEIVVDGRTRCGFLAEIEGRAAIKRGSTTIAGVGLTITLTGTEPWHVSGKAKISFFFFSVSIPFEGTFGDEPARAELPLVDAAALLRDALEQRANWETGLPPGAGPLVTLASAPTNGDEIVAHPLGRVAVRQHAIPLGVELTRVGGSRTTPDRYDVETVTVGTETPAITQLRSPFAAGQYLDLGEDERFTRPAFEPMISGFELVSRSRTRGPAIAADLTYEEFTIGPEGRVEEQRLGRPALAEVFLHAASLGAAATTTLRRDERAAAPGASETIRIRDLVPVAVDPVTLRVVPVPGLGSVGTYTEVAQAVARHAARGAAAQGDLVIVSAHEAVD